MKRLFSKKSGFTLVEIVIAFAVFAIMAAMICEVLEFAISSRSKNKELEDDVKAQAQDLVAISHIKEYDTTKGADDSLHLEFKVGSETIPMDLEYQLRAANGDSDRAGVNYFVGNINYDALNYYEDALDPDADPDDPTKDPSELGGSSIMTRFDTRITGTKGISSIKLDVDYNAETKVYTITATINDSGVDPKVRENAQITLFFGENKPNATLATIKQVNGGTKDIETLKYVKKVGNNGVNIHCKPGGFSANAAVTFTVEFEEDILDLSFGANGTDGSYTSTGSPNIYGAYDKSAPAESEPADGGDE